MNLTLDAGVVRTPRPLSPADVEAMATVLAHVEGIAREAARARIEAALAGGARALEVTDARP